MIELLTRLETLKLNNEFAAVILEWQSRYRPHPDHLYKPDQEYYDPVQGAIRYYSPEECLKLNNERAEDYESKRDKIEVIPVESLYIGTTIYVFKHDTINNYINHLANGFTALADKLKWESVIFLGDYAEPWYEGDHEFQPLQDAIGYFKSIGATDTFTGGFKVDIRDLPRFLKNYFWLCRCYASSPYRFFSSPGKSLVLYLCQYGNIHFHYYSQQYKKEIEAHAKHIGMTKAEQCFEPFSETGAIEGRRMKLKR